MTAFLGLDVGTQGARAVVYALAEAGESSGRAIATAEKEFPSGTVVDGLPDGWAEQQPLGWWQAACECLQEVARLAGSHPIRAVSVTSTSGTLCLLDAEGQPLRPALMYNDARAVDEAATVQAAGTDLAVRMGYRFNTSFSLAKLLWLANHEPQLLEQARYFSHAADFLVGHLCNVYDVSDYSNSLKTGYDLAPDGEGGFADRWPAFITDDLGLPIDKLPRVVAPGEIVGQLTPEAAQETGLQVGTLVVAGATDGCAAQIAAGAVSPGDWNSTLGTTLVIKGVTSNLLLDPQGRIYSHRHPDGFWLPGGASNVGGEVIASQFPDADLRHFDRLAASLSPTDVVTYPLARKGERFPFVHPEAEGFWLRFRPSPGAETPMGVEFGELDVGEDLWPFDSHTFFAACLEGVAYVERLAYEMLDSLGGEVGETVLAAGGAARSDVWLQIRADVLQRELARPDDPGAAMGAAILAASRIEFDSVIDAARSMVHIERRTEPRVALIGSYDERYQKFRAACLEKGYI